MVLCKAKSILVHCIIRDGPQRVSLKFLELCSLWASGREASTHPRASSRPEALREKKNALFCGDIGCYSQLRPAEAGAKHTDDQLVPSRVGTAGSAQWPGRQPVEGHRPDGGLWRVGQWPKARGAPPFRASLRQDVRAKSGGLGGQDGQQGCPGHPQDSGESQSGKQQHLAARPLPAGWGRAERVMPSSGVCGTGKQSLQSAVQPSFWHGIWLGPWGQERALGLQSANALTSFALLACSLSIFIPGPFRQPCQLFERKVTAPECLHFLPLSN